MKMFGHENDESDFLQTMFEEDDAPAPVHSEETSAELEALVSQITSMKSLLTKSQAESQRLRNEAVSSQRDRQRFGALQRMAQEKEQRLKQLEDFQALYHRAQDQLQQAQQRNDESAEELQSLYGQIESLKSSVREGEKARAQIAQKLDQRTEALEAAQEQCRARTTQLEEFKQELEALHHDIAETVQVIRDLEARYQGAIREKADLVDQAERARQQLLGLKEELKARDIIVTEAQTSKQRYKQQISVMEQQITETQRQQCQLQMALTDLRRDREALQRSKSGVEVDLKKAQQERIELEGRLQQLSEEKNRKVAELQQQNDKVSHEQRQREQCEKQAQELEEHLRAANEALSHGTAQQQKLAEDLGNKERQLEELNTQIVQLRQARDLAEEELSKYRRTAESRDADLQQAHQHLAKKVKESARLAERLEESEGRQRDLDQLCEDLKRRLIASEAEVDQARRKETEVENRCQQRILEAQGTANHWEREHGRVLQQLQHAEETNKRLRELESKYNQVSGLLANLGQLFDGSKIQEKAPERPKVMPTEQPAAEKPAVRAEEQDLFSSPPPQRRPKRNLFDS